MTEPKDSPRWKTAASTKPTEDVERLKKVQAELRAISKRLDEIAESDLGLSPETVKLLPKGFTSRSAWGDFPKVANVIASASIKISSAASDMEMGVSLAESAQIAVSKK